MNYAKTAQGAQKALKKAGQAMTLTRVSPGVYDPSTGSVVSTGATYTGFGVALNYSSRDVDGTLILQADQRVYLDPLIGATPQPGDALTVGGEVFTVVNSKPLAPGGVVVLHDIQVRK